MIDPLEHVGGHVRKDGLVKDVTLTVMLLTVRLVPMTIKIYAINARMDTLVKQLPYVSCVREIASRIKYAINETEFVAEDVMKTGLEIIVIYHAQSIANSACSLTSRFVHYAKNNFTVTCVRIHATQDVLLEMN